VSAVTRGEGAVITLLAGPLRVLGKVPPHQGLVTRGNEVAQAPEIPLRIGSGRVNQELADGAVGGSLSFRRQGLPGRGRDFVVRRQPASHAPDRQALAFERAEGP
jgi:hypothetical protein